MPVRQYANAPATTLANSCTSLATSIVVTSTTGLPITFPYTLIIDRGTATEEAVSVTAAAGTTLTVTRGIDSTTAFAHAASASVVHGITAQDIREPNAHINANSGVHGVTGSVVGTTDTQTLTGKTISADSNTLSGIAASSFVLSNASGNIDGAAAQKVVPAGAVVGTTDTQALSNKDLTAGTNTFPTSLVTLTGAQTLTNKTLTTPAMTAPTASGSLSGFGGAWSAYTPTLTGLTASTNNGRWSQVGKTITVVVSIQVTAVSGSIIVGLPVAALGLNGYVGIATAGDAGTANHVGAVVLNSVNNVLFIPSPSHAGIYNATIPFTWASGDTLTFSLVYEAA